MTRFNGRAIARAILALFYLAAGVVHITMPGAFMPVMPGWVPFPRDTILATGLCELAGAVGLMVPRTRWWAGLMLALYAICVFPVNIKHAVMGPPIPGLSNQLWYHVPRLAFQPILVWWALWVGGAIDWPFRRHGVRSADPIPRSPS